MSDIVMQAQQDGLCARAVRDNYYILYRNGEPEPTIEEYPDIISPLQLHKTIQSFLRLADNKEYLFLFFEQCEHQGLVASTNGRVMVWKQSSPLPFQPKRSTTVDTEFVAFINKFQIGGFSLGEKTVAFLTSGPTFVVNGVSRLKDWRLAVLCDANESATGYVNSINKLKRYLAVTDGRGVVRVISHGEGLRCHLRQQDPSVDIEWTLDLRGKGFQAREIPFKVSVFQAGLSFLKGRVDFIIWGDDKPSLWWDKELHVAIMPVITYV